jgi:hypothetical protein
MRKKKYFGEEILYEFLWQHCDNDGLWAGDDAAIARKFGVSEGEAHDALAGLCDRGHVEQVFREKYALTKWREREQDDPCEEMHWWEIHG